MENDNSIHETFISISEIRKETIAAGIDEADLTVRAG
jgi:hypothetical protein